MIYTKNKLNTIVGLMLFIIIVLLGVININLIYAQEEPLLVTVYADGPYEVWGGYEECTYPDYNDPRDCGYDFLGSASSTNSFNCDSEHLYFIITTMSYVAVDAIELPQGYFNALLGASNVSCREFEYEYDDEGNKRLVGDISDYDCSNEAELSARLCGPPNGLSVYIGLPDEYTCPSGPYTGGVMVHNIITPILFTVIPGINDHGEEMIDRSEKIDSFRYDERFVRRICEAKHEQDCDLVKLSDEQVRQMIIDASDQARKSGKDLVVNIDMDLEKYKLEYPLPWFLNRWVRRSAKWGARMANVVSKAFSQENPDGIRMLYAHSAGGDATVRSVRAAGRERMYDDITIINGRASAPTLKNALRRSGYEWWRVKVFTARCDLPAIFFSLSNYDAARRWGRGAWVHLHSPYLLLENGEQVPPHHSGLRNCGVKLIEQGVCGLRCPYADCICQSCPANCSGAWLEINLAGSATTSDLYTLEETMVKEWNSELP